MRHFLVLSVGLFSSVPAVAQTNRAPVAAEINETSLYRGDQTWTVTTTIFLNATDPDPSDGASRWTFQVLNPERLKDSTGTSRLECKYFEPTSKSEKTTSGPEEPIITNTLRVPCRYHPPVRFTGNDTFQYQVTDSGRAVSSPATVTINVKSQGLRWELITSAGQALNGDSLADSGAIPDILGTGTQDFTLGLDWLFRSPQYNVKEESGPGAGTFDGHFAFRLGLISGPETMSATPVLTATRMPITGAASETTVVTRRKFTTGGELNYNWVLPSTSSGAFLEVGGLVRGNVDASLEGDEDFEEVAGRVLRLVRNGESIGAFRGEGGGRIVLKQYHDNMFNQELQRGDTVEYTRNADDLIAVELGFHRDTALAGASSVDVTENRYFLRVIATPVEIPGVPGHGKPLIGIELTFKPGAPKQVKVLYGANVSAIGAAVGLGR